MSKVQFLLAEICLYNIVIWAAEKVFPMHDIFLDPKSLKTLLVSAVEVYKKETNGFLAGRPVLKRIKGKEKPVISLQTIYPLQTADRKPSQVLHGSDLAHKRTLSSLTALKMPLVGGFHSHTDYLPDIEVYPELSEGDLEHIHDEMKKMKKFGYNLDPWLELLLTIKQKEYIRPQKSGITTNTYKRKLGCTIITEPKQGYKITLSGYWLQNGSAKLKIGREAKIFSGF